MGITAFSGPVVSFGLTQGSTGQVQEYNEERGPSLFDLGNGVLDPRYFFNYRPGSPVGTRIFGFPNGAASVDYVPITAQTSAIAVSSATIPVAGTAFTLATGASAVGAITTTIIAPETGLTTASLIALDSTAQYLAYGTGGTAALWNPAAGTGRTIQVTLSATAPDIGTITIAGRDMYGIKMSETITTGGAGSTAISSYAGKKAFKYVSAVTFSSSTTINSTGVGVGFTDTFGLPLLAKNTGLSLLIKLTPTASLQYALSSGGITTGSTATQTTTSSDPRGTYASTTVSNGTQRLQITQEITPTMTNGVTATDYSIMFGAAQFSSV